MCKAKFVFKSLYLYGIKLSCVGLRYRLTRSRYTSVCAYSMFSRKAGVPLTHYKRVGGSAVGGSIGWNLLRSFFTDRFNPTTQLSDQISHCQSKITYDCRTKVWHGRLPPNTSDYYFPPTQVLPLLDFPSDPPILRSVGQWDAGLRCESNN